MSTDATGVLKIEVLMGWRHPMEQTFLTLTLSPVKQRYQIAVRRALASLGLRLGQIIACGVVEF